MRSVFEVAEWFLHRKSLTHKQLQKLCYYAQAWHLALLNRPLFDEEIQAWIHGSVIPALYPRYADYGWNKIRRLTGETPKLEGDTLEVLKAVYRTYSNFDGGQLEMLTHSELPWKEARGDLQPYEPCENIISTQSMRKYYAEKYRKAQGE